MTKSLFDPDQFVDRSAEVVSPSVRDRSKLSLRERSTRRARFSCTLGPRIPWQVRSNQARFRWMLTRTLRTAPRTRSPRQTLLGIAALNSLPPDRRRKALPEMAALPCSQRGGVVLAVSHHQQDRDRTLKQREIEGSPIPAAPQSALPSWRLSCLPAIPHRSRNRCRRSRDGHALA